MANEQNLRPPFTPSEAREMGRRGGLACGAARRKRKTLAELAGIVVNAPLEQGGEAYESVRSMVSDLDEGDMTMGVAMVAGQAAAAVDGNANAMRVMMELEEAGRRADEQSRKPFTADFALLIAPPFLSLHRAIHAGMLTDLWLEGGRGSTKSSFCSLELVNLLERDPDANALVMQRNGVDIRDGSFAQVMWAIGQLGLSDRWRGAQSARRIRNVETGQLILFKGGDDPKKTKSIALERGHIAVLWLEEADQFRGMADIRMIRQSVTRKDAHVLRMYSFNPPKTADSWANVEAARCAASDDPSEMAHKSTYLDVPVEWLGEQFVRDAEALREADERSYLHEYMGESVGTGATVFTRAAFEPISDEDMAGFERIYAGEDWGWFPDPWACVVSAWEPSTRTLYSFAEAVGNRIQPDESADMVRDLLTWGEADPVSGEAREVFHDVPVRVDDSAPALIRAHRDAGLMARKAGKGGRRMESYEWLASVRWVIDPVRCPSLAAEVRAMEYEQVDGEVLNSIPDGRDHCIDAVRYAVMPIVTRRGAYGTDRDEE